MFEVGFPYSSFDVISSEFVLPAISTSFERPIHLGEKRVTIASINKSFSVHSASFESHEVHSYPAIVVLWETRFSIPEIGLLSEDKDVLIDAGDLEVQLKRYLHSWREDARILNLWHLERVEDWNLAELLDGTEIITLKVNS